MRTPREVQEEVGRLERLADEARERGEETLGTFFNVQATAVSWGAGGEDDRPSEVIESVFAGFDKRRELKHAAVCWRDSSNAQRESYTTEVAGAVQLMVYRAKGEDGMPCEKTWCASWGHGPWPLGVQVDAQAARRAAFNALGEWALKLVHAVPS